MPFQKCAILLAALPLYSQVVLKFTPEPMAVPTAAISNAKDMGRFLVEGCNNGPVAISLPWERISMVSTIRFIDQDDALLVLTSNQAKTPAAKIVKTATLLSQALAIALAIASKANFSWSAGLAIGSSVAPAIIQTAEGRVPSIAPLTSGLKYPVDLMPGACFTDHRFAAKTAKVAVTTAVIPAVPVPVAMSAPHSTMGFEVGSNVSAEFLTR